MTKQTNSKQKGFTIIEVVLVLAIAGLIFLMVFIALPALQRGQRDTQRRHDMERVQAAIQNFQSNNRNALPAAMDGAFITKYLTVGGDTFNDPNGDPYRFNTSGGAMPSTTTWNPAAANRTIYWTKGSVCGNTEDTLQTNQGANKIAIQYKLEGGGTACFNN